MVFVLGILTLLALVGIGLIASTRMDAKRVDNQSNITSTSDSINSVVKQIQETLRQDIWGAGASVRPLDNSLQFGTGANLLGINENNEPYDAPIVDRWLSTLMPYNFGSIPVNPPGINGLFTGNNGIPPIVISPNGPAGEIDVLVWPSVSYLGSDLMIPRTAGAGTPVNEFVWPYNTRNRDLNQLVRYGPPAPPTPNALPVNANLNKVPVMQTWPPRTSIGGQPAADGEWVYDLTTGNALPMIPGSTTNVPIRRAEARWNAFLNNGDINNAITAAALTNFTPKFPYFDTNGDGIVDLYDADGDGVPDSPISFVLDGNANTPGSPSKLYAVIRVVDHGSMVNANVASSFAFSQNPPSNLMFDESNSNLQRRGRRATELLMDDVCHEGDISSLGTSNRAWQLVNYRTRLSPFINDPFQYDLNVVRRDLIGGLTANYGYRLFGLADEASLRHRFSLAPASYANYTKAPPANGVGYDKIDTALPWSTLWSNTLTTTPVANSYDRTSSRWSRNNADFQTYGSATHYEGWDFGPNYRGWRKMMTEDEPFSIRRPMFTTISRDVMLPPTDLALNPTTGGLDQLPAAGTFAVTWLNSGPNGAPTPLPLNLNDSADPWPLAQGSLPEWMRVLPLDVNMTANVIANAPAVQARYMKYMASAMFIALAGVNDASGILTQAPADRLGVACQFAANICDYRDSDGIPTAIQLPNLQIAHGLEKQPFFTEAYCRVEYHAEDPAASPQERAEDDDWFDAVELFVPPTWLVNIDKLSLRTPGSISQSGVNLGVPLAQFLRAGAPPVLDGNGASTATNIDTNGAYFVLCGATSAAPASFSGGLTPSLAFYVNAGFKPDHDDSAATPGKVELVYSDPADPLSTHVLDTIEFNKNNNTVSGNGLSPTPGGGGGGPSIPGPGGGGSSNFRWAKRDSNPAANTSERFSLARSTQGWRFTIARYQLLVEDASPGLANFETLGRGNLAQIDPGLGFDEMPEMPWPSRSKRDHSDGSSEVANGFGSGMPYEAFDSTVDISRIPLIGNAGSAPAAPNSVPTTYGTATRLFWETINGQMGTTTGNGPQLAVAAAHIDFANATRVSMFAPTYGATAPTTGPQQPWTWRLLRYLTATGHANDRIDNDGDGTVDNSNEGPNTLFRAAGRININTAPVTVLRTVPSMTLLPDSLQFTQLMTLTGTNEAALANQANTDPYNFYTVVSTPTDRKRFWDFASAIVAAREGRDVEVRQSDATGAMQRIAVCKPGASVAGGRVFESVGELMDALTTRQPAQNLSDSLGNNDYMFRADRYTVQAANLALMGHRANMNGDVAFNPAATPPVPDYRAFSPDYRYRKLEGTQPETFDFTPVGPGDSDANVQSGGIRGRDIYLSRWANVLTTRSDVFTAYIALIDEDGKYVRRAQVTFDRSNCFSEQRIGGNVPTTAILPDILLKEEGSYSDDTR